MDGARRFLLPLLAVLAGCHGSSEAPYPTYAERPEPYVPSASGINAFDAYVLAAAEAESAVSALRANPLERTLFTPQQRRDVLNALHPAMARIGRATGPCDFQYRPTSLGKAPQGRPAWRLLGHAFRWQIDDEIAKGAIDAALADARTAMRFGNDLCGGGPLDRTLGIAICNDVREAFLPSLATLDGKHLHDLAEATKAGLGRRPALEKTFANADQDARLAIQTLQDAYRAGDYTPFRTAMGRDAKDLEAVKELTGHKRADFFSLLDEDRARIAAVWRAQAALPASKRAEAGEVRLAHDKRAKVFERHFLLVGRPLMAIEDRSIARLRLLVLEAELRRVVKGSGRAPANLARVSRPWGVDPYNGRTFGYHADGAEFRVYSVGENLRDDLGDTDAAGLDPDIRTVVP